MVEDVRLVQLGDAFQPMAFREDHLPRSMGSPVQGVVNIAAQFGDDAPRRPIAAAFQRPDGTNGFALWWSPDQPPTVLAGNLVLIAAGGNQVLVRSVEGDDQAGFSATDRIYGSQGTVLGERTSAWDPEASHRPAFSVKGDLLFARPVGGATVASVTLLDTATFQPMIELALGGEHITDVLVIDRSTIFFTARGGVFLSNGTDIASIGPAAPPMRHESLDFDPAGGRVLSRGPGGYAIFDTRGRHKGGHTFNTPLDLVRGFTKDGRVWHTATASTPLRVLDAESGTTVSEYEAGDPTRGTDSRVTCVYADRLILSDSRGESRMLKLEARP